MYNTLININYNHVIYNSYLLEYKRIIITRWHLSSHSLFIETGRYDNIPRDQRICKICQIGVEDEYHVFFICSLYSTIRIKFHDFFANKTCVRDILNPKTSEQANKLAEVLFDIENPVHVCEFDHPQYYNSCTMKSCCFGGPDDNFVFSGSDFC